MPYDVNKQVWCDMISTIYWLYDYGCYMLLTTFIECNTVSKLFGANKEVLFDNDGIQDEKHIQWVWKIMRPTQASMIKTRYWNWLIGFIIFVFATTYIMISIEKWFENIAPNMGVMLYEIPCIHIRIECLLSFHIVNKWLKISFVC